ncbi:MAG: trimeric autotransporter adhesin [Myxococcales bacterium]|nr:trimeric autotransporter adhesin [Myxococcales bacterium]
MINGAQRLLLSVTLSSVGACGGGTDALTTTHAITAARGATLTLTGGSLRIPASALATDTSITVTESVPSTDTPNRDLINGLIYDFGPDGTAFKTPVELALPLTDRVPTGKSAVIAFLDAPTKTWVPLNSSVVGTAGAQKVIGLAMHFTPYAVLIVPVDSLCPTPASCGGALVGSWEVASVCQANPTPVVSHDCMDGTFETARAVTTVTGTLAITANNTYTFTRTISIDRLVSFPPGCIALTNVTESPATAACAGLEPDLTTAFSTATICAGTVTDGCTCFAPAPTSGVQMGTILVQGTSFVTSATGEAPMASTYCVQGDVLSVSTADGFVYTATRKQN